MSQVTNLAFFRARSGQSGALGAALAGPSMTPMSGLFTRTGVRLKVLTPTCCLSTCRHF